MQKLIIIIAALLLQGCMNEEILTLRSLNLPTAAEAPCCWQAVHEVVVDHKNEQHKMQAITAFSKDGFSFVLIDALGRRVFSIHQTQDKLERYKAPELPETLPYSLLIALHYLSWWPSNAWQLQAPWSLQHEGNSTEVKYKNALIVKVTHEQMADHPSEDDKIFIVHPKLDLRMTVTTKQYQAL